MVVGLAAAVISIAAIPFSSTRNTPSRLLAAVTLLFLHVSACLAYYFYVKTAPADTALYYFNTRFASNDFALGTVFVAKLTQFLRFNLGGSYLECFFFFQGIGFWGVMFLMRSFQEIQLRMRSPESVLPLYLMFLPSIHFWTSAIGKDAPLFFAVSLCVWSALDWRRRIGFLLVAMLVMVLFRAHIALIAVVSLAVAATLHAHFSFGRKAALAFVTIASALLLAGSVENTIHVDVTSAGSLASFFDQQSEIAAGISGTTSVGNAPLPLRFFSLLFRPFFFDTGGLVGIIASLENVGSVLLFGYLMKNWRTIWSLANDVFFVKFCLSFAAILVILLTLVYYNVGLGLRERVMVFPPLLCVFVSRWAMPRATSPSRLHSRDFPRADLGVRIAGSRR